MVAKKLSKMWRTVSLRITLTFGTLVIAGFFTNPTVFLTLFKNPLTFSGHVPTESLRTQDSENVYESALGHRL